MCDVFFFFWLVWWTAGGAFLTGYSKVKSPAHTLFSFQNVVSDWLQARPLLKARPHSWGGYGMRKIEGTERQFLVFIWKVYLVFFRVHFFLFLLVDSMCLAMRSSHRFSPLGCMPICCAACGCLWCVDAVQSTVRWHQVLLGLASLHAGPQMHSTLPLT